MNIFNLKLCLNYESNVPKFSDDCNFCNFTQKQINLLEQENEK